MKCTVVINLLSDRGSRKLHDCENVCVEESVSRSVGQSVSGLLERCVFV